MKEKHLGSTLGSLFEELDEVEDVENLTQKKLMESIVHFAEWVETTEKYNKPKVGLACKSVAQLGNNKTIDYVPNKFTLNECFLISQAESGDYYSPYLGVVTCPDCEDKTSKCNEETVDKYNEWVAAGKPPSKRKNMPVRL